jgi:hypothetical protein
MIIENFVVNQRIKKLPVKPILEFCGYQDLIRPLLHALNFLAKSILNSFLRVFVNLLNVNDSQISVFEVRLEVASIAIGQGSIGI